MNTLSILVDKQFSSANSVIVANLHTLMEITCLSHTFDPNHKAQYEHAIHELVSLTRLDWPANVTSDLIRKAYFDKHGAAFLEYLLSMLFWLTFDQRNPDRELTTTAAEALHWALDAIEDDLFNTPALQQLLAAMCVYATIDKHDSPTDASRTITTLFTRMVKLPAFIYAYIQNATFPPDTTTQELLAKAALRQPTYHPGQVAVMARLAWPTESEMLFECLDQFHIDQISTTLLEEWHHWFFTFPEHPNFERDLLRFYRKLPTKERHNLISSLGEPENKARAHYVIPVLADLALSSYDLSHQTIVRACRSIDDIAITPLCSWLAQHGHYTSGIDALHVVVDRYDGKSIRKWAQHVHDPILRDRVYALKPIKMTRLSTYTRTAQRLEGHIDPTGWQFEHKQLLHLCHLAVEGDKTAQIKFKDAMKAELIRVTKQHLSELDATTDLTNMLLMAKFLGDPVFQIPSPVSEWPKLQADATALLIDMCCDTEYEDICYIACHSLFELTKQAGFSLTDEQRQTLQHQLFGRIWNDEHNHKLATLALPYSTKHWHNLFKKYSGDEAPEQHRYILGVETNDTITNTLQALYIAVKPPQRRQLFRHIDQHTHPSHLPLLAQFIDQVTPSSRKILLEGIVQIEHMAIEPILLNVLQRDNQDPQVMQVAVNGLQAAGTRLSLATLLKVQKSTNGALNFAATTAISSIERRYPASDINAGQGALTLNDEEAWRGALSTTTNATEGMMSLYQDVRQIVHNAPKPEQSTAIQLASNHHIGINHVPAPPRDVPLHVLMLYMFFQNNTYGFYIFWAGILFAGLSLPLRFGLQLHVGIYAGVVFLWMIVNYLFSQTSKSIHLLEHGFMGEATLVTKEESTNDAGQHMLVYTFQIAGEDGNVYDTKINAKSTLRHLEDDPTEIALYAVDESGKVTDMQLLDQHKLIRINAQGKMRPSKTAVGMIVILALTLGFMYLF